MSLIKIYFLNNRIHVEQQGPLVINPPSDDNYGCDYCSLLCLPTSPVTLVLATRTGTVYHCLVIVGDDEEDQNNVNIIFEICCVPQV